MTRTSPNHRTAPPFVPTPIAPMRRLHAWGEVIEFFGGQHAIAAALGLPLSLVADWRDGSDMAGRYQLRLFLVGLTRGVCIEPECFGLDPAGDDRDELAFAIAVRSLAAMAAAA